MFSRDTLRALATVFTLFLVIAFTAAFFQTTYNATNVQPIVFVSGGGTTAVPTNRFVNIGQCSHWLNVTPNAATTTLTMELEGSVDTVTWFAISNVSTSTQNFELRATGYWPAIRANILTIGGAGATVTGTYSASTFCSGADGGLVGGGATSQPVTFVPAVSMSNTATNAAPITVAAAGNVIVLFGGTVYNPTGGTVYLVITAGSVGVTSPYILGVPATSSAPITMPTVGLNIPTGVAAIKAYCTTSLTAPADPGTPCQVTLIFKNGILVNGNVNVAGAQQGGQQPANPTQ